LFAPAAAPPSAAEEAQAAADAALLGEMKTALEALDPDAISPRDALDAVYKLRELLTKYS
jgi:DNA mismatch repair protein MutS